MKKLIMAVIAVIMGGFMMAMPAIVGNTAFAEEHCASTAILDGCDSGNGDSVRNTLLLVVNILSVAIGILAAIGVAIVGIQYLTAGGNEEKLRKSKRRMFEIVIGIAVYVLIYALLVWLVPSYN